MRWLVMGARLVHPYMNEDVMWERLKDMQREAENSRVWAEAHPLPLKRLRNWVEARVRSLVGPPKTRVA
jgi:hypothetical protein